MLGLLDGNLEWRDSPAGLARAPFPIHELRGNILLHSRLKEMPIAFLGHPACTSEMAVMHNLRALGLFVGIEAEDDGDGLAPVGALGRGIKQPDIACQMSFVVGTDAIQLRWSIFKGGRAHGPLHFVRTSSEDRVRLVASCHGRQNRIA